MPNDITKFEVVFGDGMIRYLRFYGDTMLQIPETGNDFRGIRTETYEINRANGERFLGCEITHGC